MSGTRAATIRGGDASLWTSHQRWSVKVALSWLSKSAFNVCSTASASTRAAKLPVQSGVCAGGAASQTVAAHSSMAQVRSALGNLGIIEFLLDQHPNMWWFDQHLGGVAASA